MGGQLHAWAALLPGSPGTHCIRGWVGHRTGLDGCGKSHLKSDPRTVEHIASYFTDWASPTHPPSYILTSSMVQSPSWAANWFAASQEIPLISRNPKVHYRTHKRSPPVSILGQPNPVHIPTSHLLGIHPNIIHPSTPRSPQWSHPPSSTEIYYVWQLWVHLAVRIYGVMLNWVSVHLSGFRCDLLL